MDNIPYPKYRPQAVRCLRILKNPRCALPGQPAQLALEGHAEAAVFAGLCDAPVDKLRSQPSSLGYGQTAHAAAHDHGGEEVAGAVAAPGVPGTVVANSVWPSL